MSWNILPKSVLQYFLEKLKTKFLLSKSNDILGSKNILPFPYTYGSGTAQGLTVTVNEDGSVTAQGTPTQDIAFYLNTTLIGDLNLSVGNELIFSEWEVQNQNAFAVFGIGSTPVSEIRGDYKVTITSEMVQQGITFLLYFARGVNLTTPVTFKPMIRLAIDTDHTWRSPALTNKALTNRVIYLNYRIEEVNAKVPQIADNLTTDDSTKALSAKQGKVLNEKFEGITFTGLLSSGVSSTGTEVEGTLSESVDNFDLIVIVFTGSGGTQCCSMVIPTRYSNRAFYGDIVQSSNVYSHGEVKVNGNKIYVKANSFSGWSGFLVSQAYGIKL